ncbi:carboxypeptidase-like regulatory domain-containing protein [Seonamhaeicola algicola]|uniref:Carboxypeptidase-like regulatory domain-containing protein n=2 Tax=Seonamhaeicola TaxID=1649495 RepID=A0A5C7AC97_9FLAO|nr:carboxypeptidase-like regulatory domain-containing protein [Seonamhaeicola algicola]TXE06188.1 carboxypeptidase-like regulatory domain-containing protein [Seonamhaeicola algicola]
MKYLITGFICLITITNSFSQQTISAKLIDSTTQKPIPFANVSYSKNAGVISNSQGVFQIHFKKQLSNKDSIFVSCMGYKPKTIAALTFTDSVLTLAPKSIELDEVLVSNKNYTAKEIIKKAYENLSKNYPLNDTKSRLFLRESHFNNITKNSIKVKETSIPELNQKFMDNIMKMMPKNASDHIEFLGDFYQSSNPETAKKLNIIKASHLYDKKLEVSFDGLEERFNSIFRKHVKRDSYFKIKSGIFGTKEAIDSSFFDSAEKKENHKKTEAFIAEQKKKEADRKKDFLKHRKHTVTNLQNDSFLLEDSHLNFLQKPNKYHFEISDHLFLNSNFVYKLHFTPKRSADYKGVIYINTEDFAIVRVDYENVKRLKNFNLLGISYQENLHKGVLIYTKNSKNAYTLKYAERENNMSFGIKRPLKIIEKNKYVKGRRKQNELSTDVHFIMSNTVKKELVVFENNIITNTVFNAFTEKPNVNPTYLPDYNPKFWEGYNVIEPNKAIKDFKSIE